MDPASNIDQSLVIEFFFTQQSMTAEAAAKSKRVSLSSVAPSRLFRATFQDNKFDVTEFVHRWRHVIGSSLFDTMDELIVPHRTSRQELLGADYPRTRTNVLGVLFNNTGSQNRHALRFYQNGRELKPDDLLVLVRGYVDGITHDRMAADQTATITQAASLKIGVALASEHGRVITSVFEDTTIIPYVAADFPSDDDFMNFQREQDEVRKRKAPSMSNTGEPSPDPDRSVARFVSPGDASSAPPNLSAAASSVPSDSTSTPVLAVNRLNVLSRRSSSFGARIATGTRNAIRTRIRSAQRVLDAELHDFHAEAASIDPTDAHDNDDDGAAAEYAIRKFAIAPAARVHVETITVDSNAVESDMMRDAAVEESLAPSSMSSVARLRLDLDQVKADLNASAAETRGLRRTVDTQFTRMERLILDTRSPAMVPDTRSHAALETAPVAPQLPAPPRVPTVVPGAEVSAPPLSYVAPGGSAVSNLDAASLSQSRSSAQRRHTTRRRRGRGSRQAGRGPPRAGVPPDVPPAPHVTDRVEAHAGALEYATPPLADNLTVRKFENTMRMRAPAANRTFDYRNEHNVKYTYVPTALPKASSRVPYRGNLQSYVARHCSTGPQPSPSIGISFPDGFDPADFDNGGTGNNGGPGGGPGGSAGSGGGNGGGGSGGGGGGGGGGRGPDWLDLPDWLRPISISWGVDCTRNHINPGDPSLPRDSSTGGSGPWFAKHPGSDAQLCHPARLVNLLDDIEGYVASMWRPLAPVQFNEKLFKQEFPKYSKSDHETKAEALTRFLRAMETCCLKHRVFLPLLASMSFDDPLGPRWDALPVHVAALVPTTFNHQISFCFRADLKLMAAFPELSSIEGTGHGYRMFLALVTLADHPLMSRAAFDTLQKAPSMATTDTVTTYTVSWLRHLEGLALLGWTLSDRFFLQAWINGLVPRLHDAGRTFYAVCVGGRGSHDAVEHKFQPGQVAHAFSEHCHSQYNVAIRDVKGARMSSLFAVRSIASVPFAGAMSHALPLNAVTTRDQRRVQFRNRYDDEGRPLCNKCGSTDHLARACTARPPANNAVAQVLCTAYDEYLASDGQVADEEQLTLEEFTVRSIQDLDFL